MSKAKQELELTLKDYEGYELDTCIEVSLQEVKMAYDEIEALEQQIGVSMLRGESEDLLSAIADVCREMDKLEKQNKEMLELLKQAKEQLATDEYGDYYDIDLYRNIEDILND